MSLLTFFHKSAQTGSKSQFDYSHMTKMATTPIQGKNSLKSSLMGLGNGMQHLECGLYQVITNDDSG